MKKRTFSRSPSILLASTGWSLTKKGRDTAQNPTIVAMSVNNTYLDIFRKDNQKLRK